MLDPVHRPLLEAALAVRDETAGPADDALLIAARTRDGRTSAVRRDHREAEAGLAELMSGSRCGDMPADGDVESVVLIHEACGQAVAPPSLAPWLPPDATFLTRTAMGFEAREATAIELGSHTCPGRQQLYMWSALLDLILRGEKTTTLRVDDPFFPGPAAMIFEFDDGTARTLDAEILAVATSTIEALSPDDVRDDGFADVDQLVEALGTIYPGVEASSSVDVVRFRITDAAEP